MGTVTGAREGLETEIKTMNRAGCCPRFLRATYATPKNWGQFRRVVRLVFLWGMVYY